MSAPKTGDTMTSSLRGYLLAAAALGLGTPVLAQTPPPATVAASGLDDIVITARRRAEALQTVPVAVSAFNAEALTALSVRTVGDLAAVTPNLTSTAGPTGGNDAFFYIRGVGQVDSNPANDPGVAVYVDGVYYARLQGASVDAQDIARVEVLRGPQGTLFGRNTIGGAVNITTLDPGDRLAFTGRVTGGSRSRIDGFGAVDLPVGDDFGVRLSLGTRNQKGWGTNVYTGKTFSDVHNLQGRIKAVWKPADDLKLTLAGDYLRARGSSAQTILTGFDPNAGQIPGTSPLGVPFPFDLAADTSSNIDKSFASIDPKSNLDNYTVSGTLDWRLSGVDVQAIVAYRQVKQFITNDFDGTGYRFYDNFFDTKSDQFSAELHISSKSFNDRLTWLGGAYAFNEKIDHNNAICLGTNLGAPFNAVRNTGGCIRNNQRFKLDVTTMAVFGQASLAVTDALSLTAGGRYTTERKRQSFDFFLDNRDGVFSFFGIPPLAYIPTLSPNNPFLNIPTRYGATFNKFTPKLGAEFKAGPDVLLYGSWSRGFKSGGFNGRPSPNAMGGFNRIDPYGPETIETFEGGVKSEFLDRRVRLNLAGFHSIYDGIQLLVLDPASGFFNNQNAGRARINGFEAELTARPLAALTLYGNVGYTDARYTYVNPLALGILITNKLPATPEWNYAVGGDYRFVLGNAGSLDFRADYNHRSSVFYGAGNAPLEFQKGFGLLNLRAQWTDRSDRFTLAAFGTNVTDVRYRSSAQDVRQALGVAFATISPPAEWGVEAGVKF